MLSWNVYLKLKGFKFKNFFIIVNSSYKLEFAGGIEYIKVGDTVLTYNFIKKELVMALVENIVSPVHHKLMKIVFSNGKEIVSTEDHPYFVNEKGWCSFSPEQTLKNYGIETGQLVISDNCLSVKNNKVKKVKVVQIVPFEKRIKTYNLSKIENSNNYFVNGILVNNESTVPEDDHYDIKK